MQAEELPVVAGASTVVVLPDTERYSDDYPEYFEAQTRWVAEEAERRSIDCVLHLGDVTQHNVADEWAVAKRSFAMLDRRVPYLIVPGNHDYAGNAPERGSSGISAAFPAAVMQAGAVSAGVFEEGSMENSYQLVEIGGREWLVLGLEMGPRDEVVAWADGVLERYAARPALVVTHAYLFRENRRYDHRVGRQRASPHRWGNDGEELWQKLLRRHGNVMVVLSGHVSSGGLGYLVSEGDYGNAVHQMMVDYEGERGGGQAFLRLLEFLPDGETVQVRTYSPALGETKDSELEAFRFTLKPADRDTPRPVTEGAEGLAKAPVHRWGFAGEVRAGGRVADEAGGADGELVAGGGVAKLDGEGRLVLSGNGMVKLPGGLLEGLEDVSLEAWFTPTAERYRWNPVVRIGGGDDWLTYVFRTLTVHRAEIAVGRHNEDIQRELAVEVGRVMHVVVTFDHDGGGDGKARMDCYLDGRRTGTMATGLQLGEIEEVGNVIGPWEGWVDELRVYDYALSEAEVLGSHAVGAGTVQLEGATDQTRGKE